MEGSGGGGGGGEEGDKEIAYIIMSLEETVSAQTARAVTEAFRVNISPLIS